MHTLPEVAKLAGVEYRTLHVWMRERLFVPSVRETTGTGVAALLSDVDLARVQNLAALRRLGLSMDGLRAAVADPKEYRAVMVTHLGILCGLEGCLMPAFVPGETNAGLLPDQLALGDEFYLSVWGREGWERERRTVVAVDRGGPETSQRLVIRLREGNREYDWCPAEDRDMASRHLRRPDDERREKEADARRDAERDAARFMFRAVDAMMAAREAWRQLGRQDLIDQLEPHYEAICEMGRADDAVKADA